MHASISTIRTALSGLIAIAGCAGCASYDGELKMEPAAVAKQLGVPMCRASIPLTQQELLDDARAGGDPHPELRSERLKIVAELQPGDQLRMIDCSRAHQNSYYVHVHDGVVATEMYTVIVD